MIRQSDASAPGSARWRRWAIRVGVACLILEVTYLIAGNLCLRLEVLENFINDKSEEVFVSWESGVTLFPGHAALRGFEYRGQTTAGQTYIHLAEAGGRVSLIGLMFKTVDLRGVDAEDVDFRYRDRIDYPCWSRDSGRPFPGTSANIEFFPEIPGFENPPNPIPEEIYSQESESDPWTVKLSGARIGGAVQFAHNDIRINGEGSVKGGMTIVLGESNAIDRGVVRLGPAAVTWASRMLTEDLDLSVDLRVKPFPAVCSEMPEIMAGTSGNVTIAGSNPDGLVMSVDALNPLVPGQGVLSIESGVGVLGGRFEKRENKSVSGRLDLVADDVILKRREIPLTGDLEMHAVLTEGDLAPRTFDVSGSTFRLDNIAQSGSSQKEQEKLEPWYGHLEIEEGIVTFGTPMTMDSHVRLQMEDTRPVLILLRKFTNEMSWLKLTRNVKGLDGTMDLGFGKGYLTVDDLNLTGENVEILGWVHIRNQIKNGRLFTRRGARTAGVAFDDGVGKVVTIKSRTWFEEQDPVLRGAVPLVGAGDGIGVVVNTTADARTYLKVQRFDVGDAHGAADQVLCARSR